MTETNEGKLVLITGASSGIGLATAELLLQHGYSVMGLSRQCPRELADHPDFYFEAIDLSELDLLPDRLTGIVRELPLPLHGVVHNAGIGKMGQLEQLSYADLRQCMDLNFTAHAMLSKAVMPLLKRQGHGDIVFIGSEAALRGTRGGSIYCASKFALRGFAQALREECGRAGMRVTVINPAATRTPFFETLDFQPGPLEQNALNPEDVAAAVLTTLQMPAHAVLDEINLSPMTRVWEKKP